MDSVVRQHNHEDIPQPFSQAQEGLIGSTSLNTVERFDNLKKELYCEVLYQKVSQKINEIPKHKTDECNKILE